MLTFPELFTGFAVLTVSVLLSAFIGYKSTVNLRKIKKAQDEKISEAKKEAEKILLEAKSGIHSIKKAAHEENEQLSAQLKKTEQILNTKEGFLKKREARAEAIISALDELEAGIKNLRLEIGKFDQKIDEKLAAIVGTSKDEMKQSLVTQYQNDVLLDKNMKIMKHEEAVKDTALRRAQEILISAIQKYTAPTSVERRSSTVKISSDEIKGRLIGKNGELLFYFEELSEVDVIFNDMPKTINISAYNLIKRHIATKAMEKLVKKRTLITKSVIKKNLEEAEQETDKIIMDIGKDVVKTLNLKNIPSDFIHIIGRLNFRTSYGQNILKHSFEVAALATSLASELDADVETCRLAAFFHDIGKAVDYDREGAHDDLTKEILEKYGFSEEIVHAAYAHHDKVPANTVPAMIVKAADAISAGRPGARQESLEKYLERLRALEDTGMSFEGVKKTFAISAGRELRVIVDPEKINDSGVSSLAKDVAHKIESSLTYPGKIKVNVIRKTRVCDYAE